MKLTDQAKQERNAYMREYMRAWRAKNKDKVSEINRRYWEKKAAQRTQGGE